MTDTNIASGQIPITFGVWIPGKGWLRGRAGEVFADERRQLAETAAAMLHQEGVAVMPVDLSLVHLEAHFLACEAQAAVVRTQAERDRAPWPTGLGTRIVDWLTGW